jgi:hypothetical protein
MTAVLLLAGCGGSSGNKSTQTSTTKSAQPTTAASTQPTTGAPTLQTTGTSPPQTTTHQTSTSASSVPQRSAPPSASAPGTVTGSFGAVTATLHAGTHHPRVQRPWPIRFTVTSGGRPTRASVSYEYLLGSQVVAHRSHYTFTGHFADVFKWPAAAVGYPLTFRAVIVAGGTTVDLDYAVQVSA